MQENAERPIQQKAAELLRDTSHAIIPVATYRLQFHKDFTFDHAIAIIPYLKQLGISHVYASPLLEARPGSAHGYDIINHNRINPELGGLDRFHDFVDALKAQGMGIVLDFVPNHMGVSPSNPWWRDVLKNGRCSRFAHFFDIDWDPLKPELKSRLLLPMLGSAYGEELESGRLKLELRENEFVITYYDNVFPVALGSLQIILAEAQLPEPLREKLNSLPAHSCEAPSQIDERQRLVPEIEGELRAWLQTPEGASDAQHALEGINGDPQRPSTFDRLHDVLEAQPYRLAFWRVSGEEINYRRFFDVNDLVGLSQEYPDVFGATHKLLREMLANKQIDGVRIDHSDGLYNPLQYLIRLQMLDIASEVCGTRPCGPVAENGIEDAVQEALTGTQYSRSTTPLYCVVEKILEHGEQLPEEWPVHGTSGYDFLNLLNGVFIETAHAQRFTAIYERFTGLSPRILDLIYVSKKLIMNVAMSSEVYVLTQMLTDISERDRYARDFTEKSLRDAIRETIACFPVYRTYIDERGEYTAKDREYVETAVRRAKRLNPGMNASVFDFLRSVLLLAPARSKLDEAAAVEDYRSKLHFALKFQQLTGPVMAKGLEDTVCYIYNRFISVNEVGGSPDVFGIKLAEFHEGNLKRAQTWPHAMLASSTHDTKRSEDVRARLNVLSEIPTAWSARALRWRRLNRTLKITLADGRVVPDANEEYLLYQTIVGSLSWHLARDRDAYIARLQQYMSKALHEGKVNLSWINDDSEYVQAVEQFIANILAEGRRGENAFVRDLLSFVPEIAFHGAMNSLAQTVIRLTAPGVPDTYQGSDMWDFSLVDPDNRRPVDYADRTRALSALAGAAADLTQHLLHDLPSGDVKLFATLHALQLRNQEQHLFRDGGYLPLYAEGDRTHHLIAFARALDGKMSITVVPRFTHTMMRGKTSAPLADAWGNTSITLPPDAPRRWKNIYTGESLFLDGDRLHCRDLFRSFPVAVLIGI